MKQHYCGLKGILSILFCLGISYANRLMASTINIQHWQTPSGSEVTFVRTEQLPMLDIRIDFAAGSAFDEGQWGLAALTLSSLDQGANGESASTVAEWFENEGSQLTTDLSRDRASILVRSLTYKNALNATIHGLMMVLGHPDFRQTDVERMKRQQLSAVRYRLSQPSDVADDSFYRLFYGEHPYAHPSLGTLKCIQKLSAADTKHFYENFYQPQRMVINMVGHITRVQAEQIANALSDALPTLQTVNQSTIPYFEHTQAKPQNHLTFASTQAAVRLGQHGIVYNDPRYYPLLVGNYALGGGSMVSLLMKEVREQRGLTYGIYSRMEMLKSLGPYIITMSTKHSSLAQALTATQQTLDSFLKDGPSAKTLAASKQYLTGSFPLKLSSNRNILDTVSTIAYYHLPWDFIKTFQKKINQVTQQQVKNAFASLQQDNPWITVTVGPDG